MSEEKLESPPDAEETDDERNRGRDDERDRDHLSDLEDGAGCTEIWEHLSERRGEGETDEE